MEGVSLKEMLMLYELWAGPRLSLETALPKCQRRGRSIVVAAASVTAETVILAFLCVHGRYVSCSRKPTWRYSQIHPREGWR